MLTKLSVRSSSFERHRQRKREESRREGGNRSAYEGGRDDRPRDDGPLRQENGDGGDAK